MGQRSRRLEVELGAGAVEDEGGAVVGTSGVLGGGEGAEPLAGALARLADLGDPLAPAALADAAVAELGVVGPTFALAFSAAGAGVCWAWALIVGVVWALGLVGLLFYWVIHFWGKKMCRESERGEGRERGFALVMGFLLFPLA